MRRSTSGFTLLEIVIVLMIISLLAGIGISNYRDYVMRANRADATSFLLRVAAAQERYYLENNTYATFADRAALGFPGARSGRKFYKLEIDPVPGGFTVGFLAMAYADMSGPQAKDAKCIHMTINQNGLRGSSPGAPDVCWR
jgi:type IV pilus assembly protein PilE